MIWKCVVMSDGLCSCERTVCDMLRRREIDQKKKKQIGIITAGCICIPVQMNLAIKFNAGLHSQCYRLGFVLFSTQYNLCFRASQGGGGQPVSSETGTPPTPHCAGPLSPTRPIFPCFLFLHSSAIFCSSGKNGPE